MIGTEPKVKTTREQILEAARIALMRDGYERITTRRIAEEAAVNIATLHYYFGSKEALLSETVRYSLEWVCGQISTAISDAPSLEEALRRGFAATWEIVRDQPGILRYDLAVRGFRDEGARAEAADIFATLHRMTQAMLVAHLPEERQNGLRVPVSDLSHYLLSAVDGVILNYFVTRDSDATLASLEIIRQNALRLFGAEDDL